MPRTLYTPRLSDDVVRALYREGLRRRKPMTVVADVLLRQALGRIANDRRCWESVKTRRPTAQRSTTPKPHRPRTTNH